MNMILVRIFVVSIVILVSYMVSFVFAILIIRSNFLPYCSVNMCVNFRLIYLGSIVNLVGCCVATIIALRGKKCSYIRDGYYKNLKLMPIILSIILISSYLCVADYYQMIQKYKMQLDADFILFLFSIIFLMPLAEEALFRVGLWELISCKYNVEIVAISTCVVWVMSHYTGANSLPIAIIPLGLTLTYLRYANQAFFTLLLVHAWNNALVALLIYR
ncbi:CPBP family intramembrane glutamic endopeptidase [Methylobacterium sp. SyP6R]|uniref:CPBP family intramembrane glutamic endopeptidase n=1 Tax=Methylobacterium sp. SyP6R TaxID=2718876 RepID=UPI003FA55793